MNWLPFGNLPANETDVIQIGLADRFGPHSSQGI
jgi:hypothetical protein